MKKILLFMLAMGCIALSALIAPEQAPAQFTNVRRPFVTVEGAADDPKPDEKPPSKHSKGRRQPTPAEKAQLHAAALARHGNLVTKLPKATEAAFDCRTQPGYVVLPIDDQGPCGSCYGVSSVDVCSMALARAGKVKPDESGRLSCQYGMDCGGFDGGCNGGLESQVIGYIKDRGFPLTTDYKPYSASVGRCSFDKAKPLLRILDYGYCTPNQEGGIATVQDMKNCLKQYGPISVAFDAGGCDGYTDGVMKGRGGNVDHAVSCIGWDDSKNAFLGRNQWGTGWGMKGYFWIDYGSYLWGTDAIWVTAGSPPGPAPAAPIITAAATSATVGSFSYQITASNAPTAYAAAGLPATLSINATTGLISGTLATSGVYPVSLAASNVVGTGTANWTLTVTGGPVPPPNPNGQPVITSPLTAIAVVNQSFVYQIAATNQPVLFAAIGLPTELTCSLTDGTISGTLTSTGKCAVTLVAINATGAGVATLNLTASLTPVNPVSITLTQEQVQVVLSAILNERMTLQELREILDWARKTPYLPSDKPVVHSNDRLDKLEEAIGELKRSNAAILKALLPKEEK